jgi:hypothetical protein
MVMVRLKIQWMVCDLVQVGGRSWLCIKAQNVSRERGSLRSTEKPGLQLSYCIYNIALNYR